jgi:rubrerythrin
MRDVADAALQALTRMLQHAYSGELAAGFAYRGHWRSVRDAGERARIRQIEEEEWHHRELVRGLMDSVGAKPLPIREAIFWTIGRVLGAMCHVTGWFLPMYGAGRLERKNIVEYEEAARHARASGHEEMIECLLSMAEVEWEHEAYFRSRVVGHPWLRVFRLWDAAPPKESIRR